MQRIQKVLIANRGEIACRIARTCRRLGIRVATVHSSADRWARHVREIGESIELGGAAPADSYLNIAAIIDVARRVGADAVHPGYGFASENPDFPRVLEEAGLIFIGPSAETIERLGGKASAKREAARLGVPVVLGSEGALRDPKAVGNLVREMTLPVLLKAVAGGGGRGMAVLTSLDDLDARIESAMREAEKAFGNGELIVERYLPKVRHIEVQIAGDGHGQAIHLFERECSLQRRHQKVIEEAPSAGLPAGLRQALLDDACRLAAGLHYRGLGTVEFIVSGDQYFFLEVNPRLQVEHPVTEEVTGLDLVELQLRIADEGRLPLEQREVRLQGHAIEARLCAEDPDAGFLPATGRITLASFPGTPVRVESGVDSGDEISPYYDSMIAKLIMRADDREQAIAGLLCGLRETAVMGLATNLRFLQQLLCLDETRYSTFHTRLIDERWSDEGSAPARQEPPPEHLCAAALLCLMRSRAQARLGCWSQWGSFTGWRLAAGERTATAMPAIVLQNLDGRWPMHYSQLDADGSLLVAYMGKTGAEHRLRATLREIGTNRYLLQCEGRGLNLTMVWDHHRIELSSPLGACSFEHVPYLEGVSADAQSSGQLTAPMMGKVVAVKAAPGDWVTQGQVVLVLESMKMELRVTAPYDGVVSELRCRPGDMVERSAVLAVITAQGD